MIEAVVEKLQQWCDQLESPTARDVADLMRQEKVVLHGAEALADDRPIIGSKFLIQDTIRTQTSPDGHFESHFLTAYPFMDGARRRWRFRKGRPSDDLTLSR